MATNTQTPRHKLTIIEDELILELASVIVADGGGTGVPGDGDMLAATYDPQGIEGDAFDMSNMTEGADAKVMTAAERASIAALGTALELKADASSLATVATTGAYADLTGTPSLVVNFGDLGDAVTVDLPTLNTPLATALTGKAATSHTHTVSQITDFPTLATVATSGAYADLIGTPTLGTAASVDSDQNLRTDDDVEFASVSISEILSLSPTTEPASPTGGTIYLDSTINRLRIWDGLAWQDFSPFNPLTIDPLFAYYAESSMLADGGGAAAQGDSIATLDDLSANGIDATQVTALYQPIAFNSYNGGPFARFDGSNDRMSFTLADPITNGTVFFATKKGSYAANLELAAGTHDFSGNKLSNTNYNFANDLVALLLFDFVLSQSQIDQLKAFFVDQGAVEDYGGQTNLTDAWRESDSLTSLYPIDASAATNLTRAWYGCNGFLQFPLIPTPLSQSYNSAWRYCVDMTDFPAGFFDDWNPSTINNSCFRLAWYNCPSLTHQSVENILVSIDTSGKYASSDGTSLGTSIFEPNIDIFYDNSGLTAATTTAITNLKNKGWIITINGTPQ